MEEAILAQPIEGCKNPDSISRDRRQGPTGRRFGDEAWNLARHYAQQPGRGGGRLHIRQHWRRLRQYRDGKHNVTTDIVAADGRVDAFLHHLRIVACS